jgi:hypothetical protein
MIQPTSTAPDLDSTVRGLVLVLVVVARAREAGYPAVTPSEQINCGKIGFRCAARPKIENENEDEDERDLSISEFGLNIVAMDYGVVGN